MVRAALVLAGVMLLGVPAAYGGEPDEATLTVHVFHDLNENGVPDEGEPGLEGWRVSAASFCSDVIAWMGTTDSTGELMVVRQTEGHDCVTISVEFGWLPLTSVLELDVSYELGDEVEILVPVRRIGEDVARYRGRLIADGLPAGPDAELAAWVGDESCGEYHLEPRLGIPLYTLYVLGAEERPGCAEEGATVAITTSGVNSGSVTFRSGEGESVDLIAGPPPMYFLLFSLDIPPLFGLVTPKIGSHECGASFRISETGIFPPNWQEVYIPSAESQANCGTTNAVVSLWEGESVRAQLMWQPGRSGGADLRHFGDATCDGVVSSVDAAVVLQLAAGLVDSLPCELSADVDQSGGLDSRDAALLLQLGAGLISWFSTE